MIKLTIDGRHIELEKPAKFLKQLQKEGQYVIASHHDFHETPGQEVMDMLLEEMYQGGADVVKLAVMPNSITDVVHLLMSTAVFHEKYPQVPVITISMGKEGVISRICGESFGSCITFGADQKASAPGQMNVTDLELILKKIHKSYGAGEKHE